MTDGFTISGLKAGRALVLGTMAVATMAMAPAPALANASAAASAGIKTPAREAAEIPAKNDSKFKQLFATWKKSESEIEKPAMKGALGVASMPSRMPIEGARFSSLYGSRIHPVSGGRKNHDGIDMAAPTGTPIYATADGRVEMAQWYGGYGNFVELDHGGNVETRYGHMSRMNVSAGQKVKKGDLLGWVGSTGRSTGPHLHYEVRIAGKAVNPQPYLNGGNVLEGPSERFQQSFAEFANLGAGGPE